MPSTVPNQRIVKVHREAAKSDFLGIKNENWEAAARDLGAHGLMLYLYFASNADGFKLALSPAHITSSIGMARSTYHDQFNKLLAYGYLVQVNRNTYEFFEKPQERATENIEKNFEKSRDGFDFEAFAAPEKPKGANSMAGDNIEINNNKQKNKVINNEDFFVVEKPKVKEIVISAPKAEVKKKPKFI